MDRPDGSKAHPRCVRITFSLIDDMTGKAFFGQDSEVTLELIAIANFPVLELTAQEAARKFWKAAVLMGATE